MQLRTNQTTSVFSPSDASLAHRARIARLISPLKRVRPRIPFWQLGAHRIPTLWTLYRGLLQDSPTPHIRWRIAMLFRQHRHITTPYPVKLKLVQGYRWADIFARAKQGDARLQAILERYSKMIAAKREKESFKLMMLRELEWQKKLRNRPILTGSYLRPTLFNPPLPRMNPQPIHITGMINKRRKANTRRGEQFGVILEDKRDLEAESQFERELSKLVKQENLPFEPVYHGHLVEWTDPIQEIMRHLRETFQNDERRQNMPYSPEMLEMIKAARREKIANKTRERQREARGEILRCTILRRRKGPPAHVLAKMTPQEKHWDKVSRSSVSEVGYVGMVKRKLGWKLRNPGAWKMENGRPGNREILEKAEKEIRAENMRRLREAEKENRLP